MAFDQKYIKNLVGKIEGASIGIDQKTEKWLDSGNYALNKTISGAYTRGLPFGKIVELFGDPSTGKSLLVCLWIANVQKMGGIAILDDVEDSYTQEFGKIMGIDNDNLILLSSNTAEEHFEKIFLGWKDSNGKIKPSLIDLIWEKDTECPILIALDSIAQLSTRHEQQVGLDKADMTKAKIMRAGLRTINSHMKRGNLLYVGCNHVTFKIGVVFGNPKTTPAGTGMPFAASVRLELTKSTKIKDVNNKELVIGETFTAKGHKNKIAAPFQEANFDVYFDKGVDPFSGLLESMLVNGTAKEGEKLGFVEVWGEQVRKRDLIPYVQQHLDKLSSVEVPTETKNISE